MGQKVDPPGAGSESHEESQKVSKLSMSLKMRGQFCKLALILLAVAPLVITGCTSSTVSTATQQSSGPTGSAFVVGTDAPLNSVVSFATTIKVTATPVGDTPGGSSDVTLVSAQNVDFARYNGLQTLLDQNDVKAQSYQSITITLTGGTIGYLNVPASGAPTIQTITPVTYTTGTNPVTITLAPPFVVPTTGAPAGIRIDFDLSKSILLNSSNAVSGTVTPTFDLSTVKNSDSAAHIDEQIGAVVQTPQTATPNNFIIQGPHGENFTVVTGSTTEWDGGAKLQDLNTTSVVAVAGQLDVADQTLDADEVALITDSNFYATGLVTYVTSATSGTPAEATGLDFYVRSVLPSDLSEVPLGGISQVAISGKENYGIYWMHNAFTEFLFNPYALTPGQEIAVGGADPTGSGPISVKRIHLQNWGYNGTVEPKTQNSGQGTFTMKITGFAGLVVPTDVIVYLGPQCDFRYGFGAFTDLADGASVRVVGLLLKDPTNGQLVLLGRHIDGINLTDMTATAWQ